MEVFKKSFENASEAKKPIPKRHHFVPEMLQANFANAEGILHFFRKEQVADGVRAASPGDLFVKNHLYSSVDKEKRKDPALELWFSKLETKISPLIRRILVEARRDKVYSLTREEKEDWKRK